MTTQQSALADLEALSDMQAASEMARLHKIDRPYLGLSNPQIDTLYKAWRVDTTTPERVTIAAHLWDSNIFEARIAAAKLLTQARINPDASVWAEIERWVPALDSTAIADHVCSAGARRLPADPSRLDRLEGWTTDENIWVRRAALTMTLPWAKLNHPSKQDLAARDRVLGWAALYVTDHDPIIQKAVALWLRTLSKHDKQPVRDFLDAHKEHMKPYAAKEAAARL